MLLTYCELYLIMLKLRFLRNHIMNEVYGNEDMAGMEKNKYWRKGSLNEC